MNLTSCDNCGVVLDADKLAFPVNIYVEGGAVNDERGIWDGSNYVPFVRCPVCQERVPKA